MKALLRTLLILLAALGLLLLWSAAEPYVIGEEVATVALPSLPEAWDGQRVAVIADLQVGMWLGNTWTIRRIVGRLIEERPAAVLIAGDFVYHPEGGPNDEVTHAAELLRPLVEAGVPAYAVLGNHDYQMPTAKAPKDAALAERVSAALETVGVQVLHNEVAPLSLPRGAPPLYLVGIGPRIPDEDDVDAALAQLPDTAPRLTLMHHPDSFTLFPADSAPLAFAAHTHGGQFRLPFTPQWSWMAYSEADAVHTDGWIEGYGEAGNQLYVNRGIGFSVAPLRLNSTPELTLITLQNAGP